MTNQETKDIQYPLCLQKGSLQKRENEEMSLSKDKESSKNGGEEIKPGASRLFRLR